MSYVLRVLKFRSYFSTAARSFINNSSIIERSLYFKLPIQLGPAKICQRTFGFQHSQPKDDFINASRDKTLESDFQFLDSILERGSFLNKKTLENIITKASYADEITPSQAVFLLSCCGNASILESRATRRKLVSRVWKIYQDKGLPLDISHYNAFLQILVETEAEFSPLEFLATLEEKNIKPNRITYSRLIAKFCQKGDIDGANKILEHMKNNGLEINEYIFSSLILGNARANDLDGALAVVDIMKQNKINNGPDTYAALIQAYAEHKKFDEIDAVLSDVKKELLSENLLLEIVCSLVSRCSPSVIEKVIDSLENKENMPLALIRQTCSHMIFAGHDELAYKLFKKIPRNENQNFIGSFFPKLMATAGNDLYKVVKYCDDLRKNGYNIISFENALESYLQDH
ncbi:Leucine-rich PPR motif-containing protein, mitochondrial [Armadillidium nasatum]|uniref:Leucine-rich PPR motif-containing protein, mitochondrial n=1 Tax=Armadillidium nasatum TaxID=96803 RepID=A0A5N5T0Y4_9CRUS|nr:Leucine-rich PPR motif-containing protein, mitochondrial [Armadillidium nasatum]